MLNSTLEEEDITRTIGIRVINVSLIVSFI